jgi:hypothetical protein
MIASSAAIGLVATAIVHGDFEAMKKVLGGGVFVALCLFIAAAVIAVTGHETAYRAAVRIAIVCSLAVPLVFVASPVVFRFELWRAKRYVEMELKTALERDRSDGGGYPKEWRIWEAPPSGAPWLISRFRYWSDGREYGLSVMNPGVCGHVVSYRSSTSGWSETYDPCWY